MLLLCSINVMFCPWVYFCNIADVLLIFHIAFLLICMLYNWIFFVNSALAALCFNVNVIRCTAVIGHFVFHTNLNKLYDKREIQGMNAQ